MDSLSDSVATTVVLIASLIDRFAGVQIDGWGGMLVALFIFWTGLNAARDTLNPLLGQPPSQEFVDNIRKIVMAHPGVLGLHDLIVHDYGPGRRMVSCTRKSPPARMCWHFMMRSTISKWNCGTHWAAWQSSIWTRW